LQSHEPQQLPDFFSVFPADFFTGFFVFFSMNVTSLHIVVYLAKNGFCPEYKYYL